MADRLRIGVVGAGTVVERYHIPAINGVPEVIRSVVVDADGERARRVAHRYGFPEWSTDLDDVVGRVDLAVVAVPNAQHAPVASELLSRGIHILCEKPMARNVEECNRMIESSRRGAAQLCIGHNRRFRPHMPLARRLLHKGLIGDILSVEAEEGSPNDWPRSPAYFDPVESGGGALLDVGVHSVDLIRWLVGDFDHLEYKGNGTEARVESEAELNFRLLGGQTGRILVSRTRQLRQRLVLVGSGGFLEIGLWEPRLGIRSAAGKAFQNFESLDIAVPRRPPQDSSFVDQLSNFVSAVRGREKLLVDGYEGMAAVEVVCRAYHGESRDLSGALRAHSDRG